MNPCESSRLPVNPSRLQEELPLSQVEALLLRLSRLELLPLLLAPAACFDEAALLSALRRISSLFWNLTVQLPVNPEVQTPRLPVNHEIQTPRLPVNPEILTPCMPVSPDTIHPRPHPPCTPVS